jgi:ribosomal 50S subunit-recycling heat shock protein
MTIPIPLLGSASAALGGGDFVLEGVFMRLDKYLKVSRLIKRRTVANEACDNGLVTVNGKPARASYDVKVGDQISLRFGVRTVTVEVLSVQETVKQADAATLYREIGR